MDTFAIDTTYFVDSHPLLRTSTCVGCSTQLSTAELARTLGQDAGVPGLNRDLAYDQKIPLPPLAEQRAIADYLDAETARIDALIAKKQQLIHLLEERLKSFLETWSGELGLRFGSISLRRLCSGVEQGWSPVCDGVPATADEWGVLKTSAISPRRFAPAENKKLPEGVEPERRWQVRDGDLLMSRGSGSLSRVAAACVADVGDRLLTISDLVYRVRLNKGVDPGLTAALLGSPGARRQIESSIRTDAGQTLKVRGDDLLDIQIPNLLTLEQRSAMLELETAVQKAMASTALLARQISLLTERRQALITAAVTGEFAVPGAA